MPRLVSKDKPPNQFPRGKLKIKKGKPILTMAHFERNEVFIFRSRTRSGRQKVRKISAPTFELAKEKAILQYSNVLYFKQKPMDLVTALARAAKASKDAKKPYYIILDGEDGECSINTAPLRGATHKFVNGKEVKEFYDNHAQKAKEEVEEKPTKAKAKSIPAQSDKAQELIRAKKAAKESAVKDSQKIKQQKEMEKKAKKSAKKAAKKAGKKSSGKRGKDLSAIGKKVTMTNKEMTAKIKKGFKYYNEQGTNKTKYIPERPNQDLVNENYWEVKPE